jgi:hypothetical protein
MSDTRNALLAWLSSAPPLLAAIENRDLITIISAIVLPVIFFTVGKTIDIVLQVYLKKGDRRDR